jgi:hypothetical protein
MESKCIKPIADVTKYISNLRVSANLYQILETGDINVLLIMENSSLMMSTHITLQDAIVVRDMLNELIEKSSEILS